jgi:hypothetical protein
MTAIAQFGKNNIDRTADESPSQPTKISSPGIIIITIWASLCDYLPHSKK